MSSVEYKLLSRISRLSKKSKDLVVFLIATLLISLFMSTVIHNLISIVRFKEGDIATSTIRAPKDMVINIQSSETESKPMFLEIKRNEVIVRAGDKIGFEQAYKLRAINQVQVSSRPIKSWGGYFILTCTILLTVYSYFVKFYPSFRPKTQDLALICTVLFLSLISIQIFSILGKSLSETFDFFTHDTFLLAAPSAAGGMILQIILGANAVNMFVLVFGLLTGVFLESSWLFLALVVLGNLMGASGVRRCTKRSIFLRAALRVSALNVVIVLAFLLLYGDYQASEKLYRVLAAVIGGVFSGIIAVAIIPVAEYFGKYTTDMKLLELSSLDQPLLRELSVQAPGTWNHSMVVGQMGEAAAEAIYANPLLVRVGAYYHDIGKSKFPAYFIENQFGENRHDKLTPSMSALIIKTHVKDGIDMAQAQGIPPVLIDMIQQHHGTSLIEYFFEKAKREAEEGEAVDESHFRYSGPKPQSKEAAILMLADTIEATSRTLSDPSPAKLQGLVQKIINKIFVSGELDESGLTLKDLHIIAKYFVRVLTGIYHKRVEYPESSDKNKKRENGVENLDDKADKADNHLEKVDTKKVQNGTFKSKDSEDNSGNLRRLGI